MHWKSKVAVMLGALFVFAVGSSRVAYAAPPTDACSLLTPAQVNAVLGVSTGPGKPSAGTHDCEWALGVFPRRKIVLVEILGPMGTLTPADRFNTVKAPVPFGHITKTPVSGLGDDAVYVETAGAALYVRKGGFVFQIRIQGFPLDRIKAKEKTLAQDVLAKL